MPTKKTEIPIVIDQTTGLPELPEDHAWRIGDSIIEIVKHLPAGEWSDWLDYDPGLHYPDRETEELVQTGEARRNFWGKCKTPVATKWWRMRREPQDYAVFAQRYGEWDYYFEYALVAPDRITKANIVERTTGVYREWRASVSAKREQEEIQGLYPPNTIKGEK